MMTMTLSRDEMVGRTLASDPAAGGRFIVGVKTTSIYCLPACHPPRQPNSLSGKSLERLMQPLSACLGTFRIGCKPENRVFFGSPDEARGAGFRACKLCKPDDAYRASGADADGSEGAMRSAEMTAYVDTIAEAPGPLAFAVDDAGALLWLKFLDGRYARAIEQELEREGFRIARDYERTARARTELLEYCAGARRTFDVPLIFRGSAWQNTVWRALTRIPFGETRAYGAVAAMIGRPEAARAVGRASATNRLPLVVPCHRVLGADGSLTGFGGGLRLKVRLLAHEGVRVADPRR
jgi:methylated-DNA-[protein]-cysteine S-methyltransferase